MINKNDYINLSQDVLNIEFTTACYNSDIEFVKYLLTSSDLKKHADIHAQNDYGLRFACYNRKTEIVKYLLTSPDLKEHANLHANDDEVFKSTCEHGNLKIAEYLIFDFNINKTQKIKKCLKENPNKQIENMFKMREFNKNLNNELNYNINKTNKKIKI